MQHALALRAAFEITEIVPLVEREGLATRQPEADMGAALQGRTRNAWLARDERKVLAVDVTVHPCRELAEDAGHVES